MSNKEIVNDSFTSQIACIVCNSINKDIVYNNLIHTCNVLKHAGVHLNNEDVPADVYQCKECMHRYLSIVLKDSLISKYYGIVGSEYYDEVKNNTSDRNFRLTSKLVSAIRTTSGTNSSVLEIGSGLGHLLLNLQNIGYDCYGVEPSVVISDLSRKTFNLNVKTGILDYNTFLNIQFDLIILNDVIEHIYEPNSLFKLIDHYLKPGGKVFILTGNSRSDYARMCGKKWKYFYSWEHISFFNKSSIKYLFAKYNLKMILFKKLEHSGSRKWGVKLVFYTLRAMATNFIGLRKTRFYHMAFDHFIAIGQKQTIK